MAREAAAIMAAGVVDISETATGGTTMGAANGVSELLPGFSSLLKGDDRAASLSPGAGAGAAFAISRVRSNWLQRLTDNA
jgi:hypothetical protein